MLCNMPREFREYGLNWGDSIKEEYMRLSEGPVKHFDYRGEAAVENSDGLSLLGLLKKRKIAYPEERLAEFRLSFNENSNSNMPKIIISAHLYTTSDLVGGTKEVSKLRAVEVTLEASEFFGFFKRFDLLLTNPNLQTENANVIGPFYDEDD